MKASTGKAIKEYFYVEMQTADPCTQCHIMWKKKCKVFIAT